VGIYAPYFEHYRKQAIVEMDWDWDWDCDHFEAAPTGVWCTIGWLESIFYQPKSLSTLYLRPDEAARRAIPIIDVRNQPNDICEAFDILVKTGWKI
jgi:hypothetical protein